jgi:hypothetical protein
MYSLDCCKSVRADAKTAWPGKQLRFRSHQVNAFFLEIYTNKSPPWLGSENKVNISPSRFSLPRVSGLSSS